MRLPPKIHCRKRVTAQATWQQPGPDAVEEVRVRVGPDTVDEVSVRVRLKPDAVEEVHKN